MVTLRDTGNDIQTSNKPLGASTIMDCTQVHTACDHRPRGAMRGRGWDASIANDCPKWCHAVSRLASLAFCFSMIKTTRPGAMVVMGEAVVHGGLQFYRQHNTKNLTVSLTISAHAGS